jgi:predicted nucleotidyltransferase component of viral defense system
VIPQRNISRLSNRLAEGGGRRIPEAVLERDYCIAWLLVGAGSTELPSLLTFKGGTALKRCHFADYRFSEDLDFTLMPGADLQQALEALGEAYIQTAKASGITIRHSRDEVEQGLNSHTFYIAYEGPLPAAARLKEIKVDITLTEQLVYDVERKPVLRSYDEFEDLPQDALISVYSLREIAAEKTLAVLDRARTEPRDLYDLWYLITDMPLNLEEIFAAVEQKLAFRGKALAEVAANFKDKERRYKALWQTRLASQMATLPHFEETFREVQRSLRQAGLITA